MEPAFSLKAALKDLKMSYATGIAQDAKHDKQFMLLRYEELCKNPEKEIANIASFLNIPVTPGLHYPTVAGMPTQANSSFNSDAASGQILKPNEHQQTDILTRPEQDLLLAYTGALAKQLNYPVVTPGILCGLCLRFKYRLF
jgi:hypothetical protein